MTDWLVWFSKWKHEAPETTASKTPRFNRTFLIHLLEDHNRNIFKKKSVPTILKLKELWWERQFVPFFCCPKRLARLRLNGCWHEKVHHYVMPNDDAPPLQNSVQCCWGYVIITNGHVQLFILTGKLQTETVIFNHPSLDMILMIDMFSVVGLVQQMRRAVRWMAGSGGAIQVWE